MPILPSVRRRQPLFSLISISRSSSTGGWRAGGAFAPAQAPRLLPPLHNHDLAPMAILRQAAATRSLGASTPITTRTTSLCPASSNSVRRRASAGRRLGLCLRQVQQQSAALHNGLGGRLLRVTGLPVPADIHRAHAQARIFGCGQADRRAKDEGAGTLLGGQTLYLHLLDPLPSLLLTTYLKKCICFI
jgi:hypothetical protein